MGTDQNGDEPVGRRAKRRRITFLRRNRCQMCKHHRMDTASDYDYECPLLGGAICETHCTELHLTIADDTRELLAQMMGGDFAEANDAVRYEQVMSVCRTCPFCGQISGREDGSC